MNDTSLPRTDPRDLYGSDAPIMLWMIRALDAEERRMRSRHALARLVADYGADQVLEWVRVAIARQQGAPPCP
jgi:hypothetical protein